MNSNSEVANTPNNSAANTSSSSKSATQGHQPNTPTIQRPASTVSNASPPTGTTNVTPKTSTSQATNSTNNSSGTTGASNPPQTASSTITPQTQAPVTTHIVLPQAVIRNLSDKLKEKRRLGGEEIENMVRRFLQNHDEAAIKKLLQIIQSQFIESIQPNMRKGGLWAFAAAAIALYKNIEFHLNELVPPVLKCFADQDNKVRFHACEAMYNIAKIARSSLLPFFNEIFDGLCKLSADTDSSVKSANNLLDRLMKDIITEGDDFHVEDFIPLIKERISSTNPFIRQFLVGWIMVLDSVPDISLLEYLPQFLHGLFLMLNDANKEIIQQASTALEEFLQEIEELNESVDFGSLVSILIELCPSSDNLIKEKALIWVHKFLLVGKEKLLPYNDKLLAVIMPSIAHNQEVIRKCASKASHQLMRLIQNTNSDVNFGNLIYVIKHELDKYSVPSRIAALQWLHILLNKDLEKVMDHIDEIFDLLMRALSDSDEEVVKLDLQVLAIISSTEQNFTKFLTKLLDLFKRDRNILNDKSIFIIRQLSIMLNPEKIYREIAKILQNEKNLDFCSVVIETLNMILLTSNELSELRALIKSSPTSEEGRDLYTALYIAWCHNPISTLCLCLLAKAYEHASALVVCFAEIEVTVEFLIQIDNLVQLIESPVFADLRMQLLDSKQNPFLLKTLYGILMLLPQSSAYEKLNKRLQCVSMFSMQTEFHNAKKGSDDETFKDLLSHFKSIQAEHKLSKSGEL